MCDFGSYILTFIKAKFACFIDNETRRPVSVVCAAFYFSFFYLQNSDGKGKPARRGSPRRNNNQYLFQFKKGTPERGQVWDYTADNLNAMDYP